MIKNRKTIVLFIQKIIIFTTLLFCIFIFLGTIITGESNLFTEIYSPFMRVVLLIFMSLTIFLFLQFIFSLIDRWTNRQLNIFSVICFFVMILIFIVILYNFRSVPYNDALNVQDTALYFAETEVNEYSDNSPHYDYFSSIGNNNFLVILLSYFFKFLQLLDIQDTILPLNILATIGILVSALFTYLIGIRIGGLRKASKILALCVLNPLYYLLVLWAYTNVFSIPFMMATLYFAICAWQAKHEWQRILYCSLTICCAIIGYYIRATVLIPLIAVLCCVILLIIYGRRIIRKFSRCCIVALLVGVLLFNGINSLNDSYFSSVSNGYLPVTHWLMMGSHGNGTHNSADMSFTRSFESIEEKQEATIEKTVENYQNYNLYELIRLFAKKIIKNWCYGDGGDLFSKINQETRHTVLYSWVLGERSDFLRLYCYAFWMTTFLLIILSLFSMLKSKKLLRYSFLIVLSFLGGLLFYLFWEVKSTYSLPFIYIMLIIASDSKSSLQKIEPFIEKHFHWKGKTYVHALVIISIILVFSVNFNNMSNTIITIKNWSIQSTNGQSSTTKIYYEGSLNLSQEFSASNAFDTIVLGAKADEKALEENVGYQIFLEDENGQELYSGEVYAQDISKGNKIVIHTGEIIPEKNEVYKIIILSKSQYNNQIQFLQFKNSYIDIYTGKMILNGTEHQNDLWLQVYSQYNSVWASKKTSIIINATWFIILLTLIEKVCFRKNKIKLKQPFDNA